VRTGRRTGGLVLTSFSLFDLLPQSLPAFSFPSTHSLFFFLFFFFFFFFLFFFLLLVVLWLWGLVSVCGKSTSSFKGLRNRLTSTHVWSPGDKFVSSIGADSAARYFYLIGAPLRNFLESRPSLILRRTGPALPTGIRPLSLFPEGYCDVLRCRVSSKSQAPISSSALASNFSSSGRVYIHVVTFAFSPKYVSSVSPQDLLLT